MRILKYQYEKNIADRDARRDARNHKTPAPAKVEAAGAHREGGKRHYVAPSTGFYTSEQPLSASGEKWDKKRKVRDGCGRLKSQFSCSDTNEFGEMGNIRHYSDVNKMRTYSHKPLLFPSNRSMQAEIGRGFGDLHCVDEWEKKILSTQGQRTVYKTQNEAMKVLANDFRASMANPARTYR